MAEPQPVSFPKVTVLIAGLFLRRFGNRLVSNLRRKKPEPGVRAGTGRKNIGNPLGLVALIVIFLFNTLNLSSDSMRTLASELGPPHDAAGRVEVSASTCVRLREFARANEGISPGTNPGYESALNQVFQFENDAGNSNSKADYTRALIQCYEEKGVDGFVVDTRRPHTWIPRIRAWNDPILRPLLLHSIGLMLLILAGARHCWTLGSRNQDLGQVEWSTEWLFTLPATTRSLFGAQILGHAFVDPFAWIATIPLLLVIHVSAGAGWPAAIASALFSSIYLSLVMASVRVASETWLRKHLAPVRLKNFQALFTLVGIVLLFLLLALARSQEVVQWVVRIASGCSPLLIWNPFSLPIAAFSVSPVAVGACEICSGAVIVFGSILLCSFLVRDGLVALPGVYAGGRASAPVRDFLPAGIIGKDLRLLLRDRNFFVQTLVAPALIVCFQIFFNVSMAQSIGSNFHHAATFAFGVGAYVLISTGLNVLAVEGNSLWMLYGLPISLPTLMLRKTLLWSALGLCYAATVLALCAWHIGHFKGVDLSYTTVALAGVLIYSFIASGMGMLATDPLEVEVKRRIRPGMIYLYMILASLYGYALYAPSTWARFGQIILSALLAYALWQKVRDRAPFLLDAVSMPPPRVSLADGLMAALGFFVLQGLFSILFIEKIHMPLGRSIVLAYSAAGVLVAGFTLLMFWRARMVEVLSSIGFSGPRDGRPLRAILIGVAMGLGGGLVAFCYLRMLHFIPAFDSLSEQARELTYVRGWWLVLLVVLAAPLCEEFIFRGLVFRGMRRSLSVGWSVAGSAAVFAICHPPISVIPVFVLGVLAALGFEITGWIVTPICIHMTYNGLVLLAGLLPHGGRI